MAGGERLPPEEKVAGSNPAGVIRRVRRAGSVGLKKIFIIIRCKKTAEMLFFVGVYTLGGIFDIINLCSKL